MGLVPEQGVVGDGHGKDRTSIVVASFPGSFAAAPNLFIVSTRWEARMTGCVDGLGSHNVLGIPIIFHESLVDFVNQSLMTIAHALQHKRDVLVKSDEVPSKHRLRFLPCTGGRL